VRAALSARFPTRIRDRHTQAALSTPDLRARAVIAVYEGAMAQVLLEPDLPELRTWVRDLLQTVVVSTA
jgi:hypothetical protein